MKNKPQAARADRSALSNYGFALLYSVLFATAANACPPLPAITTASSVASGSTGVIASVADHPGSTYAWTLNGGTITQGQGTSSVQYSVGSAGSRMTLSVIETDAGACSSPPATKHVVVDFADVPPSDLFHSFIITLALNGVTAGCGGGNYCPGNPVLRSQMAIFLLRGEHGETYAPPPAVGIFADVPVPSFVADFIERLYNEGITGGCAANPLRYCPNNSVLRSQMAIFLLRAKHGAGYVPPPAVGIFQDVPPGSFAADFIERLYNEGITGGCSANPPLYCPNDATTRGAMAVFLDRTFGLQANNTSASITVDAGQSRHPIDPGIYGVAFADPARFTDLGVTINRWGGNATSRYNWAFSTANRCKDFYFENQPDPVSSGDGSLGKSADDFIAPTRVANVDVVMTIPMMNLLPKERSVLCGFRESVYPGQDDHDPNRIDCGNGKVLGARLRPPNYDPLYTSASYQSSHQGDWIQHMIDTHGNAAGGGVKYYALDNEPTLWSFDHWDVHPNGETYDEATAKMLEYGALIKLKDPTSLTTGVEEWGWDGYFMSGVDQENGNDADRNAHGTTYYAEYLLQKARDYELVPGHTRILDYFSLHFYPQSGEFSDDVSDAMQAIRNKSTRALWDPTFVDLSWIGGSRFENGKVRLIPRMKEWVGLDYPGTKIGITEYNWGAENHINGATAQADILGIFGREGLDLGVRWTAPPTDSLTYNAFKMYRNYDGLQSRFGETSVHASGPNPDDVATFAAQRANGTLTQMVIAKTKDVAYDVTINLANFNPTGPAQRWQLTATNAITHMADIPLAGPSLTLTVPAQSITLLVIPGN